jgi:hypothetical protein
VIVQVWSSRVAGTSPLGVSSLQAGATGAVVGVADTTGVDSAADGEAAPGDGLAIGDAQPASSKAASAM